MTTSVELKTDLYLLKHPFYQAWVEGTLPKHSLKDYAEQYYHHVEAFPRYLQNALTHTVPTAAQEILAENLAEEDGTAYGTSHPELWLRFAEGVGAPRANVRTAHLRHGISQVVNTFTRLSQASWPQALGALYAYESQVPEIAHSKIEGLKTHFAIHDERTLAFFEVHKTADVAHRASLKQLLDQLTPAEQAQAQLAADEACRALWDFLSDVHKVSACA